MSDVFQRRVFPNRSLAGSSAVGGPALTVDGAPTGNVTDACPSGPSADAAGDPTGGGDTPIPPTLFAVQGGQRARGRVSSTGIVLPLQDVESTTP